MNVTVHGFGGFCLVCLQLVAPLHLHGAVNDPVWSQRLQPLNLHDHHLTNRMQRGTSGSQVSKGQFPLQEHKGK